MKKLSLVAALIGSLMIGGCAPKAPISNEEVHFAVEQSHSLVKAGESVTFTAHATGTAGRKESIRWRTDGGELSLVNNMERYARVEYDKPGTYVVIASLYVDGNLVDEEQALVRVDPLT